jgi:hypothetical protein
MHHDIFLQYEIVFHQFFCFQSPIGETFAIASHTDQRLHVNHVQRIREKKQHFPLKNAFLTWKMSIFPIASDVLQACTPADNPSTSRRN